MKYKITLLLASVLISSNAYADTCATKLMPTFTSAQATKLCSSFTGSSSVIASIIPATTNLYTVGDSSHLFANVFTTTLTLPTTATGAIIGEASRAANVLTTTGSSPALYASVDGSVISGAAYIGRGANTNAFELDFFKTRATTGQATTIVQSGDGLGTLRFYGANGTGYSAAGQIVATVDGTPGATTDMPGAIDFQVSADGTSTMATALKLSNAKLATFAGGIKSTATNVGWQQRATANTACDTTCTAAHGCLFGFDAGGSTLVDCAAATADTCICSF